ncbi:MAG: phosphopantothenoylcysteine decarboxylase domain-containing protein [Planctomycetota bacterium]|jgi:phosphopantothenoylcysteine decarboxylase/phosphopantothenate--cysteine ligase
MHILITAGRTREYIDPVRFISNASSGKMGYALARAAVKAGHKVTLIAANTNLCKPPKARVICVETGKDMFEAVKKYFPKADCLIMAAAVSDYTPVKVSRTKIKKGSDNLTIELKPTTDILAWAGRQKKKNQVLIGFALEDKNIRKRAEQKLKQKNLDMIIANRPSAIGAEESSVEIKTYNGNWARTKKTSKDVIARKIISLIAGLKPS